MRLNNLCRFKDGTASILMCLWAGLENFVKAVPDKSEGTVLIAVLISYNGAIKLLVMELLLFWVGLCVGGMQKETL